MKCSHKSLRRKFPPPRSLSALTSTISRSSTSRLTATPSISLDPQITLPGFKVGKPEMRIVSNTYPPTFGDLAVPQGETYSRVVLSVPSNLAARPTAAAKAY
jgi:hypothetical protein